MSVLEEKITIRASSHGHENKTGEAGDRRISGRERRKARLRPARMRQLSRTCLICHKTRLSSTLAFASSACGFVVAFGKLAGVGQLVQTMPATHRDGPCVRHLLERRR